MTQRLLDNFDQVDAERICIIKPSALGDVIQATSVLGPLRRRFPRATITWVIKRSLQDLLRDHPQIDSLILFDDSGSWRGTFGALRQLRRARFDLTLDLQGLLRSGVMTWATGARLRVGLETSREGAHLSYNRVLTGSGWELSAHDRMWRVAEACGAGQAQPPRLVVSEEARRWAAAALSGLPGPLLAVGPGTRWATKQWPVENFAAVVGRVLGERGGSAVLVGSGDESPLTKQLQSIERRAGRTPLDLAGRTSLPRLAAVLAACDALLSNDSGAMHLAAAVGTPVTGVFTSTTPEISGPVGAERRLIATSAACAGCYKKKCPLADTPLICHQMVDVDEVAGAVGELLSRPRLRSTG